MIIRSAVVLFRKGKAFLDPQKRRRVLLLVTLPEREGGKGGRKRRDEHLLVPPQVRGSTKKERGKRVRHPSHHAAGPGWYPPFTAPYRLTSRGKRKERKRGLALLNQ